jgi:hypothetical protein
MKHPDFDRIVRRRACVIVRREKQINLSEMSYRMGCSKDLFLSTMNRPFSERAEEWFWYKLAEVRHAAP